MDITLVLAQILGIIFTIVGISILISKKGISALVEETVKNNGLMWLWGFITLGFGAVIISLNNTWGSGTQSLITIIGWLALIKGAFILIFPKSVTSLYKKWNIGGVLIFTGLIALILGLILLYKGLM